MKVILKSNPYKNLSQDKKPNLIIGKIYDIEIRYPESPSIYTDKNDDLKYFIINKNKDYIEIRKKDFLFLTEYRNKRIKNIL